MRHGHSSRFNRESTFNHWGRSHRTHPRPDQNRSRLETPSCEPKRRRCRRRPRVNPPPRQRQRDGRSRISSTGGDNLGGNRSGAATAGWNPNRSQESPCCSTDATRNHGRHRPRLDRRPMPRPDPDLLADLGTRDREWIELLANSYASWIPTTQKPPLGRPESWPTGSMSNRPCGFQRWWPAAVWRTLDGTNRCSPRTP